MYNHNFVILFCKDIYYAYYRQVLMILVHGLLTGIEELQVAQERVYTDVDPAVAERIALTRLL